MANLMNPRGMALRELGELEVFPDKDECVTCEPTKGEWEDYCSQGTCPRGYDERREGRLGD